MSDKHKRTDEVRHFLGWVRAIQNKRSLRDSHGQFWIEGVRQILWAAEAGWEFETIVHSPVLLTCGIAEKLVRKLAARGVRRIKATPEEFRGLCLLPRASGVGAVVRQRWTRLNELILHRPGERPPPHRRRAGPSSGRLGRAWSSNVCARRGIWERFCGRRRPWVSVA